MEVGREGSIYNNTEVVIQLTSLMNPPTLIDKEECLNRHEKSVFGFESRYLNCPENGPSVSVFEKSSDIRV